MLNLDYLRKILNSFFNKSNLFFKNYFSVQKFFNLRSPLSRFFSPNFIVSSVFSYVFFFSQISNILEHILNNYSNLSVSSLIEII